MARPTLGYTHFPAALLLDRCMGSAPADIQSAEATPRGGVALPLNLPYHAAASPPRCNGAGPDLSSGFRWNDG